MRIKHLITVVIVLLGLSIEPAFAQFPNEKNIEFKSDAGEVTSAFEGFLMVPENRNNPDSRQIRVNYVRFPATGKEKGNPIFYLAGGPGSSGIGTAKWRRYPLFMALRQFGDVIALDQRGTGQSEQAETCYSAQKISLTERLTDDDIESRYRVAALECLATWKQQGIDVYGYTTVQNALDINQLRQHLNADKVVLWGISYGSHLAMSAMKLFPEHIEKVIMASAEGLDQTVKLPAQTDAYFQRIQAIINQQPLAANISDLPAVMQRVHHKLEHEPMPLEIPQRDGSTVAMLLQRYHMQMLASKMIADPGRYLTFLIHIYNTLDKGNPELLLQALQMGIFKEEAISFRLMPLAMDIASGVSAKKLDMINSQAKSALLGKYLNFPMPALNNLDPQLDLGAEFRSELEADIPTLLFTGTLDGRTYPESQTEAVSGLGHVTQIKVVNAGHNLYTSSPEVLERMISFLGNSSVSEQDIQLPLPEFEL